MVSSSWIRSGLKSLSLMTTPPRTVSLPAFAERSPTIGISPKAFLGPTATALFTWTRIASRDS
jgi:hypothetical protein